MWIIHYPSGGFGHYLYRFIAASFDSVFEPSLDYSFDELGSSHHYPLHYEKSEDMGPPIFDFGGRESIALIDTGIENDKLSDIHDSWPLTKTIRLVIDEDAKHIVRQTMMIKAGQSFFPVSKTAPWITRFDHTREYHRISKRPDHPLNKFSYNPKYTININISDLCLFPDIVLGQLQPHFGDVNQIKFSRLSTRFTIANSPYIFGNVMGNMVLSALKHKNKMFMTGIQSEQDRGYINFLIERKYNVKINPLKHREWFKNSDEVLELLDD